MANGASTRESVEPGVKQLATIAYNLGEDFLLAGYKARPLSVLAWLEIAGAVTLFKYVLQEDYHFRGPPTDESTSGMLWAWLLAR